MREQGPNGVNSLARGVDGDGVAPCAGDTVTPKGGKGGAAKGVAAEAKSDDCSGNTFLLCSELEGSGGGTEA